MDQVVASKHGIHYSDLFQPAVSPPQQKAVQDVSSHDSVGSAADECQPACQLFDIDYVV